ncbi:long-chain fatty acid--CoA ligase [bacterium]|nr:long-chain fatty acid--CoA ligase [bacterium]
MNLVELADQNYIKFGEIPAIVYEDQYYTNLQLITSANQLANGLAKLGIKPKSRVVVMLKNSPEVLISYQALLRISAIVVPTLFLLDAKEVAHILTNSEATAVITDKEFLETINSAKKDVRSLKHVIVTGNEEIPGTLSMSELMKNSPVEKPDIKLEENHMAVLLYTSGTTGDPKGVILTHKNLYSNALSSSKLDHQRDPNEASLFLLPLSHSFGLTVMNMGFMYPNLNVMIPWFEVEKACQLIEKYKITGFAAVPTIFTLLLNNPDITAKYDLSSLKECVSGAAPLTAEVMQEFEGKFGCRIYQGYGLSEAGPIVTAHYRNRPIKPGSIGQALPDVEIKIVDENDEEVGVNEVGELIVFGPSVSPGYYNLPVLTKQAFRDGWLYTGDMVKMDEEGYLYIVDRKKDVIIRGGFNIIPRDIEEVLLRHPAVSDVAVIGIQDRIMGEEIKAFIATQPGNNVNEEEIIEHCKDYLADYKCPKHIEFINSIPRNAIGKILRKELRR